MAQPTPHLLARLFALGIAVVLLQVDLVSQITVLGVSADLLPLVVGAVGLLCGSVAGAAFGFAAGLFLDTALLHTLGVSSLVYVLSGYGAGRLRELRDPQGALVPMGVGTACTAAATIGFSLIQFLLGVDAPVSGELFFQILTTIIVNALLALPVYTVVRRWLIRALPDDPRRRRRRAYTTGGLSPLSRA